MQPRTTICCTVGPASADPEVLRGLVRGGAAVFRLNGALCGVDDIHRWVELVREAAREVGREVGVLLDLPGPKLRVGTLAAPGRFALRPGDEVRMDADPETGSARRIPVRSIQAFADVKAGGHVVLGDGRERLEVLRSDGQALTLRVVEGGEVRTGMGVHFPGAVLPTAVPTRQDRVLLAAGVEAGVDMVAQSFVRTPEDVARLKEALAEAGARHLLAVVKIERLEAVAVLDRIVERADALIVARGDLGIDAGVEHVPVLQRRVLEAGRRAARPVIIATEMLDSMTRSTRPTRAEASDVAGAVFEGADAVMLSGETALGRDPVLVVQTMARILAAAEQDPAAPCAGSPLLPPPTHRPGRPDQHVVRAAVDLARETGARAIIVFTRTGSSALRLSKERPAAAIHAFTPTVDVARRLTLAWGVSALPLPGVGGTDEIVQAALRHLKASGDLAAGDRAVAVMGGAKDPAGATTLVQLILV